MIRGSSGSRRWWRRERCFCRTRKTTEETRRANFKRWDLLRRGQRLRQQLGETAAKVAAHSQEPWTGIHFRIRELGRKLRAASRRAQAQAEECVQRLAGHTAHSKKRTKRKSCPKWSVPAELFVMALDSLYFAVRLDSAWAWL